jgi:L-iditol 2-dehydrogenase
LQTGAIRGLTYRRTASSPGICLSGYRSLRRHSGGTIFYFGVADDDSPPISMRTMLRNNLTLKSGVTLERRRALALANLFAVEHPRLLPTYLARTFGIEDVQARFELACRPVPGRVKIAITESGSA